MELVALQGLGCAALQRQITLLLCAMFPGARVVGTTGVWDEIWTVWG